MAKIEIAKVIGNSLDSRDQAEKLFAIIEKIQSSDVILNFENVEFMSRSFADQFYQNAKQIGVANKMTLDFENVNNQIKEILDAVSKTQFNRKVINKQVRVYTFPEMSKLKDYLLGI